MAWKQDKFKEKKKRLYSSAGHHYTQELSCPGQDKEEIYTLIEQEILDYFGDIKGYYCLFTDITLQREYQQMILTYANTDALTGLYNRRYFYEYIEEHISTPMTIFYMDMDNFKKINDKLGHAVGDSALITIGEKLNEFFHEGLVARIGGDEFTALMPGTMEQADAEALAEAIRQWTEDTFAYMQLGISLSVGIGHSNGGKTNIDAVLEESDKMMYQIKREKKMGGAT